MNKQSHHSVVVLMALACLLVASCTSKRKLVSPMSRVADYAWMTGKMTVEVASEEGAASSAKMGDFTGAIRMRRDSVIWVSVSAVMGIETIRACVNNDSVVVLNRFDKTYLSEPLVEVAERFHLPSSLQECQSRLLGNGTSDQVTIQWGPYIAKIRYSDIHWDEPTTFPIKVTDSYERRRL